MSEYAQSTDTGIKYFDRNQITKLYYPGRTVVVGVIVRF
jgi:hypothetical protein